MILRYLTLISAGIACAAIVPLMDEASRARGFFLTDGTLMPVLVIAVAIAVAATCTAAGYYQGDPFFRPRQERKRREIYPPV